MTTRRLRATQNSHYVQPLKLANSINNFIVASNRAYTSILYRLDRRAPKYETKVWAKFDVTDFDGIQLLAYINKNNNQIIHGANCTFTVNLINTNSTWNETFLYSTSGTQQINGSFIADVTQTNLGSTNELDGELTLSIECEIYRFGKKYKNKIYVNHLGVYDSIIRLRQEVEFLFVTKKDE